MQRYALHIGLHNDCILMKAPIHKGSEGFTYNNTIKKVKLYKKIKVKIIIENIVFVVCCLHWLHLIGWGWRTPNGRPYGNGYCWSDPSTASGPPSLKRDGKSWLP